MNKFLVMMYRFGGNVGREETDQVPAGAVQGGGRGRTTGAQPLRDDQSLLRTVTHSDSRPRRKEPSPTDQRLESIRE